jgi:hypothetical protein
VRYFVVVTCTYEALHCWPDCTLGKVGYLRNPHRHLFHIRMEKEVGHCNREIEIITFRRDILEYLDTAYDGDLGSGSCEDVAAAMLTFFQAESVEVLEDGENGAVVRA